MVNIYGDPIDLDGCIAVAQIRKHYTSSNAVNFTTSVSGSSGYVTLSLTANQTSDMSPGRYVYDCELIAQDQSVIRLIEGIVTITPGVTR